MEETSETGVRERNKPDKSSAGIDMSRGPRVINDMSQETDMPYLGARPKTTTAHRYYTRGGAADDHEQSVAGRQEIYSGAQRGANSDVSKRARMHKDIPVEDHDSEEEREKVEDDDDDDDDDWDRESSTRYMLACPRTPSPKGSAHQAHEFRKKVNDDIEPEDSVSNLSRGPLRDTSMTRRVDQLSDMVAALTNIVRGAFDTFDGDERNQPGKRTKGETDRPKRPMGSSSRDHNNYRSEDEQRSTSMTKREQSLGRIDKSSSHSRNLIGEHKTRKERTEFHSKQKHVTNREQRSPSGGQVSFCRSSNLNGENQRYSRSNLSACHEEGCSFRTNRSKQEDKNSHSPSSSRSSSSERCNSTKSRKPRMLPDKYNGTTSVESFFAQFETCARYNEWNERDKVAYLKWCLSGTAAQLLWDIGPSARLTYNELVRKIRQRFGSEGQEERYQTELRTRRRKRGESLQSLYQDIRRLMSLAYPGETSRIGEQIAKDAFLTALDDAHLELRCREQEPKDLDTALRIAVRFELYERVVGSASGNAHANRQVQIQRDGTKMSQMEHQIRELQNNQKQQELQMRALRSYGQPNRSNQADNDNQGLQPINPGYPGNDMSSGHRIPVCYFCNQPGHIRPNCPQRIGHNAQTMDNHHVPTPLVNLQPQVVSQIAACNRLTKSENASNSWKPGNVYLKIFINGRDEACLLDSGCDISVFPKRMITGSIIKPTDTKLSEASGSPFDLTGEANITFACGDLLMTVHGVVSERVNNIILGQDFLTANNAVWDFPMSKLYMHDREFSLFAQTSTGLSRKVVLTISTRPLPILIQKRTIENPAEYQDIPRTTLVEGNVNAVPANLNDECLRTPVKALQASHTISPGLAERAVCLNEQMTVSAQQFDLSKLLDNSPVSETGPVTIEPIGLSLNVDNIGNETEMKLWKHKIPSADVNTVVESTEVTIDKTREYRGENMKSIHRTVRGRFNFHQKGSQKGSGQTEKLHTVNACQVKPETLVSSERNPNRHCNTRRERVRGRTKNRHTPVWWGYRRLAQG